MERFIIAGILIVSAIFFAQFSFSTPQVQAQDSGQARMTEEVLDAPQPVHTQSRFQTKIETITKTLDRAVEYQDDPDSEIGQEKTLQEGSNGTKTTVVKTYFTDGAEYDQEILSEETIPAVKKIIAKGTKIVWRTLETADGQIRYWRKLRVWATHYDSHCLGCDQWTAIGMHQGKGVIAVDPSVIKLRSKVYVPGYGLAVAGDTGGAIKGNIIDLGFDDARTAGWSAKFVDIYLL